MVRGSAMARPKLDDGRLMTRSLANLPDYPLLQQLARALWRNGTTRGAAVLVGAGFSKHAECAAPDTPKPPLWTELISTMAAELYCGDTAKIPANPLRVAEEYRSYLGQAALDDFILKRFPDAAWQPGTLHAELLELPWADMLTTNWDTLLERASDHATSQSYEIVRSESDLPRARSPRIVKLHGTLRYGEQLIFAEEDYRTYPVKHAAFVNFARQVFIENELCLVGFSGNDPNFLQWAGWVRDQLGGSARRIYLVDNLDLAPATRRFLEMHNIAPIDLAPAVQDVGESKRYAAAAALFFGALRDLKPPPLHEWRTQPLGSYPMRSAGLEMHEQVRKNDDLAAQILERTIDVWRAERRAYPGWLVCPRRHRQLLKFTGDENWLLRKPVFEKLSPARRVQVLQELLWRRKTAFVPLDETLRGFLAALADPSFSDIDTATRHDFAIALMRAARIGEDDEALAKWHSVIQESTDATPEAKLESTYQLCLRARDRLDLAAIRSLLPQLESDQPVWCMRRAALLSELGEYKQATKLINDAAQNLDRQQRLDRVSLSIRSHRGWAKWLSRVIDRDFHFSLPDPAAMAEFEQASISPADEIEAIDAAAVTIISKRLEESVEAIPMFEPGHYKESRPRETGTTQAAFDEFYELDQLIEIVGLPLRLNNVGIASGAAVNVVKAAFDGSFFWYAWLIRALHSHFDNPFHRYFSRIAVAQMAEQTWKRLQPAVMAALDHWSLALRSADHAPERDRGYAIDELRLMIMVLSRLTPRLSQEDAASVFRRAVVLAREPALHHAWLTEAMGELLRYSAQAVSISKRSELAWDALEFPLSIESGVQERFWPSIITVFWVANPNRPASDAKWSRRVAELIAAADKESTSREEAVLRLAYLTARGTLLSDEAADFGRALWSELDGGEPGLPARTRLLPNILLKITAPKGIDVASRLRARYYDAGLTPVVTPPAPLDTLVLSERQNYVLALQMAAVGGLPLTAPEAQRLFAEVTGWTLAASERQDSFSAMFVKSFTEGMRVRLGDVLTYAIIPALPISDVTETTAQILLEFIERTKSWHAIAGLSRFGAAGICGDKVVAVIRRGIAASDFRLVAGACGAIRLWAERKGMQDAQAVPRVLIEQAISILEVGQKDSVHPLLDVVRRLLLANALQDNDKQRLLQILEDLRVSTRYAEIDLESRKAVSVSLVRVECVKLVRALEAIGLEHSAIRDWLCDARNDPLPEVRFAVEQGNGDPGIDDI